MSAIIVYLGDASLVGEEGNTTKDGSLVGVKKILFLAKTETPMMWEYEMPRA